MTVMSMMQVALNEVVDVVPMRDRFMAAARTVSVTGIMGSALMTRCAGRRIRGVDREAVFIDVIRMGMMEMTVVQIIHMAFMLECKMATAFSMNMRVGTVLRTRHIKFLQVIDEVAR